MLLNQLVMEKNKLIFVLCSMLLSRGSYAASSSHEAGLDRGAQISTRSTHGEVNCTTLIPKICSTLLSRGTSAASSHEADPSRRAQISTEEALSKKSENSCIILSGEEAEVNEADYPRLDFDYEEKKINLIKIFKNSITKLPVLDYKYYITGTPDTTKINTNY
jgi:hypothetical protein